MKYKVTLNGKTYEVEVEAGKAILLDEYEACAPAPAAAPVAAAAPAPAAAAPAPAAAVTLAAGETIEAPMPGNILDVKVKPGDSVKAGDVLLILEAMKMENEISAPQDGTVASVNVRKGDVVNSGDLLCTMN